ncbi:LuxR C-terminal-related transcriptional regulator [Nocardioides dubius]
MVQAPPGSWASLPWFMASIPTLRVEVIARPRLDSLLDDAQVRSPLTLVTAPSGYGKTVATAMWARSRADVVWVSASAATDSFTIVRGALLEALPADLRGRLALLDPEESAPDPLQLIARIATPTTVIIDDAHLLDREAVRHTIASEPALSSGLLQVVLIGQPALETAYSRELGTGLATAITAVDLAFTLDDVETLLAERDAPADPERSRRLHAASGGWPVGVRMLLLGGESDTEELEHAWDGRLADYVEHEVLARLPEELRTFVLEASTCARATPSLVFLLTGRDDSRALLAQCREQGLFIDAYADARADEHEVIYRWHDTFVNLTHTIRMRQDPDRARALHRVAAQALRRAFPGAAVEQALLADDPDLAADVIRSSWLGMLLSSQTTSLDQLCLSLPEELQSQPDILLIRACCCDILGEQSAASALRHRAQSMADADGGSEFVRRFSDLYLHSDPVAKAEAADRAQELLAGLAEAGEHPHAVFLLGWVELRLRRDPERAVEVLGSAVRAAHAAGESALAARAHANRAFALTYGGRFNEALAALDTIDAANLLDSQWESFDGGLSLFSRGYAHFYRGELVQAYDVFDRMVKEGGTDGSFLDLGRVYFALSASVLERAAVYDEAEYHLSRLSNHDRHGVPWESYKRLAAARLLEARGKAGAALEVAEPLLNRGGLPATHSLLAEMYRRLDEPALAKVALQRIERRARPRYVHVGALVTTAALTAAQGQSEDAHKYLERALLVAEPDQAWYPFLARDSVVTELLDAHPRSGSAELLLAEISRRRSAFHEAPGGTLTPREQEILHLLRTTMTTQEIAAELHLSLNTVKTHLRAIYRKLGVPNRRSAVRLMS